MFSTNPFAELSASISPAVMQGYVITMIVLVAVGTIFDVLHKKSGQYFRESWRREKARATRDVSGGEMVSIAVKTAVVDVAASGEFCNARRRIAHLLTMYGFIAFAVATALLVFRYPAESSPGVLAQVWHIGALMLFIGTAWFWLFIRVDVSAEGHSRWRVTKADLFVGALIDTSLLALIWSYLQHTGSSWATLAFGLFVLAATVLFATVPWSKFAHMFFKPAAAFEKRVAAARGSYNNLPPPAEKPETFGRVSHQPRNY